MLGAIVLLLVACNSGGVGFNGDVVGGACRGDRDCAEQCVGGGDFPDGTCTVACRDDRDCPASTWCAEKAGGVCLLDCYDDRDCRVNYTCKDVDSHGAGGRVAVCIGR